MMAKSLVRNRAAVTKMYGLKSQLQAVSLRLATLKSTQAMADAMGGATKAMRMMNKQLNMPQVGELCLSIGMDGWYPRKSLHAQTFRNSRGEANLEAGHVGLLNCGIQAAAALHLD